MADWIDPREWVVGEGITATKLNEISESINYVHDKPKSIVTIFGSGADLTTTSTTIVAVDDAQFTLSLQVIAGESVVVALVVDTTGSTTNINPVYDVIIDDTTYVSSNTATPLTAGLWTRYTPTAATSVSGLPAAPVIITGLVAGVHTFKLRWKVSAAGTATLYLNAKFCQFSARIL